MPLDFTKNAVPPPTLGRRAKVEPGFVPEPKKATRSQVVSGLRAVGGYVGGREEAIDRPKVEQYKAHYRAVEARKTYEATTASPLPVEPSGDQIHEYLTYARAGLDPKPDWMPSHYEPWTIAKCIQLAQAMKGKTGAFPLGKTVPTMNISYESVQMTYEIRLEDEGFMWRWRLSASDLHHYQDDLLADTLFHELNRAQARLGANVMAKHRRSTHEYLQLPEQWTVKDYEQTKQLYKKATANPYKPSYIDDRSGPEVSWPDRD